VGSCGLYKRTGGGGGGGEFLNSLKYGAWTWWVHIVSSDFPLLTVISVSHKIR